MSSGGTDEADICTEHATGVVDDRNDSQRRHMGAGNLRATGVDETAHMTRLLPPLNIPETAT